MAIKIDSPAELRAVLLQTMTGVLAGEISVQQANSVVGLSAEAHKSIRQQWDMAVYASDNLVIADGKVTKLIEAG